MEEKGLFSSSFLLTRQEWKQTLGDFSLFPSLLLLAVPRPDDRPDRSQEGENDRRASISFFFPLPLSFPFFWVGPVHNRGDGEFIIFSPLFSGALAGRHLYRGRTGRFFLLPLSITAGLRNRSAIHENGKRFSFLFFFLFFFSLSTVGWTRKIGKG